MSGEPDVDGVAAALRVSLGLFSRRLRHTQAEGELTLPESSALARLDRDGPATASQLAKAEQISRQSMAETLGALEARGLIERRPDPGDGRRVVLSVSEAGLRVLRDRRHAKTERLARALSAHFTQSELDQLMAAAKLIERLAQSV